jgi:hypothetical protein
MPKALRGAPGDFYMAAERKLDIAGHHAEQLVGLLPNSSMILNRC